MKSTKRNTLLEVGILQNVIEVESMNYGWEHTHGALRSRSRYVGNIYDFGFVYSERDFKHTKLCIKRDDIGEYHETWAAVFGVTELSETEFDVYAALIEPKEREIRDDSWILGETPSGIGDTRSGGGKFGSNLGPRKKESTLSIVRMRVNTSSRSATVLDRYAEVEILLLNWGLILVRNRGRVSVFASSVEDPADTSSREPPVDIALEYDFSDEPWNKRVMGIFGYEVKVHTVNGYLRFKYGEDAEFRNYTCRWSHDGLMEGTVNINRSQKLVDVLRGGAPIMLWCKPFEQPVPWTDLYEDMSMAFGGYMTDFADTGNNLIGVSMECSLHALSKFTLNVLIDNITFGPGGPTITPQNCFDVIRSACEKELRLRDFTFTPKPPYWHAQHDRVFAVSGDLLNSVINFSYFLGLSMTAKPVEEGTFVDVDIHDPGTGTELDVAVDEESISEKENLIMNLDIYKLIGPGRYINKLRGMCFIPELGIEWSPLRSTRLKRLLAVELASVEDQNIRFGQFIRGKEEVTTRVENFLEDQVYDWGGNIELHGSHHYLGGVEPQGRVTIRHGRRGFESRTFRIAGFEMTGKNTKVFLTQRPRILERAIEGEFEQAVVYEQTKNIFDSIRKSTLEIWVDEIIPFDTTNIVSAKLIGEDGLDITDWVDVNESIFQGYKFVDARFSEDDWVGISDYFNPEKLRLMNSVGAISDFEMVDFYKSGCWILDPDPYSIGDKMYHSEVYATIGFLEDNYKFEILDGYLVLGEISGGLGEPYGGGGRFGDPRGDEYLET